MKSCPRCGRQNEDDVRFCGRCGLDLVEYEQHQARPATEDTMYCYRHPKEATNLSCGRCGKPICTKCAVIGPAGPRCPDCAKQNVTVRPAAVIHEAKRAVTGIGRLGPYGIYIVVLIAISALGALRGCACNTQHGRIPQEYSRPDQDDGPSETRSI
ncbi:MAG: zinc-ribbon domain-containing protein [Armatimonadetes bacterium]|nr:zinc-ribbon domain-containing protein [Armatimonadota bacterium]MBS1702515.1 zinc-ribbon domain-containing protein [Armatimonadota bacterium]